MGDEDLHERARLLDNDSEDEDDFFLRGPTTRWVSSTSFGDPFSLPVQF